MAPCRSAPTGRPCRHARRHRPGSLTVPGSVSRQAALRKHSCCSVLLHSLPSRRCSYVCSHMVSLGLQRVSRYWVQAPHCGQCASKSAVTMRSCAVQFVQQVNPVVWSCHTWENGQRHRPIRAARCQGQIPKGVGVGFLRALGSDAGKAAIRPCSFKGELHASS
jgi:hypothetical protein